ncbi:hypothetical protein MLD38_027988 [Melastoma candidum]|uniref:Uncharacterized protein n=1 Tax=Melastoma candidum TaxID=119954 RepID=A0ACB9MZK0_9MYRT|nr:hypothetical protein MLD38_027988 [Melastoma candidum]
MSEKIGRIPSRFIFYLMTSSAFLLILSCVFLFEFSATKTVSSRILNLVLENSTTIHFRTTATSYQSTVMPKSRIGGGIPWEGVQKPCSPSEGVEEASSPLKKKLACDPDKALLRVFMYDLPPEFHFGLLGWKGSRNRNWPNVNNHGKIPPYPGGLNLQHSIEYWLTLDLLSSEFPDFVRPCTASRVANSSQAEVLFVPFFSSLSYNRFSKINGERNTSVNRILQNRLVQYLKGQNEWKRLGGKDHIIVAHHPNSMLDARKKLGSAMFVLADFGRYPPEIANLDKDIIAPYKHVVRTLPQAESAPFEKRPILAYFRGAIYRKDKGFIRQELFYLLKDAKDVHFAFGNVQGHGVSHAGQGMASSKFCLNIAGDTPSSNRLFDAIVNHCVPVIISDEIELPFEDVLDYSEFCIFIHSTDAVKKDFLLSHLRGISKDEWTDKWKRLKVVARHFEFQYPSKPGDAIDMIWQAVGRKISSVKMEEHRKNRYHRSKIFIKGS